MNRLWQTNLKTRLNLKKRIACRNTSLNYLLCFMLFWVSTFVRYSFYWSSFSILGHRFGAFTLLIRTWENQVECCCQTDSNPFRVQFYTIYFSATSIICSEFLISKHADCCFYIKTFQSRVAWKSVAMERSLDCSLEW